MAGGMRLSSILRNALMLLAVLPAAVLADVLPDPTRPPSEISAPAATEGEVAESGLQSVIIAPGRRAAIINGQTVELGGKYGDARLIEVNERGVVLRGPQGREVLPLFPGVDIKRRALQPEKPPAAKPAAAGKPTVGKAAAKAVPREEK